MKFWDSSALMPLVVDEAGTHSMEALAQEDPVMLAWWGSEVECVSAIARLERQGDLSRDGALASLERLDSLTDSCSEVLPVDPVRRTARRLLQTHVLRAADALQLAAAVIAGEGQPASLDFVTLDDRLADAARREGFTVHGGS